MEEHNDGDFDELPGYLGGATMVVLLALAAESLSEGHTLAAVVPAILAISCFYRGANLLVKEVGRGDGPSAVH
jgi:hypothetical protein